MKYVLGIDSGGTKYLIKAAALDGTILATHTGPNAYHTRVGAEEAFRRISDSVSACLAAFCAKAQDCLYITVGTAGLDVPGDEADIEAIYRRLPGFACPIQVVNDAQIALYAATGGVGVLTIAGTGTIAFGRDPSGRSARVGGWPPLIGGDEGSGTWIALEALKHVSRVIDGMDDATSLSALLKERMGLLGGRELMDVCEKIEKRTFQDPGISRWVNEVADAGDPIAQRILQNAGQLAAELAKAVIKQLDFGAQTPFMACVWGSAIVKSQRHLAAFTQSLALSYPQARVHIADIDAADGAILMALSASTKSTLSSDTGVGREISLTAL